MTDLTQDANAATVLEIRRLRWQCRRGMLELDHLLDRFLDLGYADLNAVERSTFLALLGEQDTRLSDWFMSRAEPDAPYGELIRHIVEVVGRQSHAATPHHPE